MLYVSAGIEEKYELGRTVILKNLNEKIHEVKKVA